MVNLVLKLHCLLLKSRMKVLEHVKKVSSYARDLSLSQLLLIKQNLINLTYTEIKITDNKIHNRFSRFSWKK